jgi:SAM-dependent methyltransferase
MQWPIRALPNTYFPDPALNRMKSAGDAGGARVHFLSTEPNNLTYLLRNRYGWMNRFIAPDDVVVEIGAGAGLSQKFVDSRIILTDVEPNPWIDACADGLQLPFGNATIDVTICTNVLHHFTSPVGFLNGLQRCLKPGGRVLIFEPNPGLLLLLMLRIMRHEGWSFAVDVFDPTAAVNDPTDPWSGNNAVSEMMFADHQEFEKNLTGFEIIHDQFSECLMFPLSGGVTAKRKTLELPMVALKIIDSIDRMLCCLSPGIFAMGRTVALLKR